MAEYLFTPDTDVNETVVARYLDDDEENNADSPLSLLASRAVALQERTIHHDASSTLSEELLSSAGSVRTASGPERRLQSVDVFRGIIMAIMLLVDVSGKYYPGIGHAPWNGIHLADIVMPCFLFTVGASASLGRPKELNTISARTIKLFFIGLWCQGRRNRDDWRVDLYSVRIMGILQRIAFAYFAVAWLERLPLRNSTDALYRRHGWKWFGALFFLALHTLIVECMSARGCNAREWVDGLSDCNVAAWVDSHCVKPNHMYHACLDGVDNKCPMFDPEGVATSLGTIFTCYSGLHAGRILVYETRKEKARQWAIFSTSLLFCSLICRLGGIPFNKQMWSLPYNLLMTAVATGIMGALHLSLDTMGDHRWHAAAQPFRWLGQNAILFFIGSDCTGVAKALLSLLYWKTPEHSVAWWFQYHVLGTFGLHCTELPVVNDCPMILMYSLLQIVVWVMICYALQRKGIFLRV